MEDLSLFVSRIVAVENIPSEINWKAMNLPTPASEKKYVIRKAAVDLAKVAYIFRNRLTTGKRVVTLEYDLGGVVNLADKFENVLYAWRQYKASLNDFIFIDDKDEVIEQKGDIVL